VARGKGARGSSWFLVFGLRQSLFPSDLRNPDSPTHPWSLIPCPFLSTLRPCVVINSWGAITPTTGASLESSKVTYLKRPPTRCPASSLPKVRTRVREVSRTARLNIWPALSTLERTESSVMVVRHMAKILLWKSLAYRARQSTTNRDPSTSRDGSRCSPSCCAQDDIPL